MGQQMVNGSYYKGDITVTNRMTDRYAVVNPPFQGKHMKPLDAASRAMRKVRHMRKRTNSNRAR